MKRFICILISVCLLSTMISANSLNESQNGNSPMDSGIRQEVMEQSISSNKEANEPICSEVILRATKGITNLHPAFGIDVSFWQGRINWNVASKYIDFAIIRCGYGYQSNQVEDDYWKYNVSECERLGIPYGVYFYSSASTLEQVTSEAKHVIRLLKGHKPSLPVYYDLEDNKVESLSNQRILQHAKAFCTAIKAAGYSPGVYSCLDWWNNRLYFNEYTQWARWVAHYTTKNRNYDQMYNMWQYGTARIPGISGEVDANYLYTGLVRKEDNLRCGGGPICPSRRFKDLPEYGSWAHSGIDFCIERGIMNGISNTKFGTNSAVSRGQIVTVLYRLADSPKRTYQGKFYDVARGEWYTPAVEWAASCGIVKGTNKSIFSPNDNLTREQLATILYRYAGCPKTYGNLNSFPDGKRVSSYAKTAMIWATSNGLIRGVESKGYVRLYPERTVTRAQLASIIMRFLQ